MAKVRITSITKVDYAFTKKIPADLLIYPRKAKFLPADGKMAHWSHGIIYSHLTMAY